MWRQLKLLKNTNYNYRRDDSQVERLTRIKPYDKISSKETLDLLYNR
ncbi:MAG: hypothetical protein LN568_03370 [Rickettsia endosymbiont of Pseudomimeciton antennatum]|nr:hypothetical protein [Rickettsia endosymbiont of Pseudomimeciton antennatum]